MNEKRLHCRCGCPKERHGPAHNPWCAGCSSCDGFIPVHTPGIGRELASVPNSERLNR